MFILLGGGGLYYSGEGMNHLDFVIGNLSPHLETLYTHELTKAKRAHVIGIPSNDSTGPEPGVRYSGPLLENYGTSKS